MSRQQQQEIESLRDQLKVAQRHLEQKRAAEEARINATAAAKAFKRQEADRENITKGLIPVEILRGLICGVSTHSEPGGVTETTIGLTFVEGDLNANERRAMKALTDPAPKMHLKFAAGGYTGPGPQGDDEITFYYDETINDAVKVGDIVDFFPSTDLDNVGLAFVRANGANAWA